MENPWWFPWLRWRRENDGTELALATAGLASVATMVVAGDVNERARCSDARKHGGARVWCSDGGAMVARCRPESCRRWRCDGGTRKKTQRLESRRRGSGRFEMLERNGGGVPARARRGGCSLAGAAFWRELRWSDVVGAAMEDDGCGMVLVRKREKRKN